MIMLVQAVKPKLQFVIPLTLAAACAAAQRLSLGGLSGPVFCISYPAAPPKAAGEKLI